MRRSVSNAIYERACWREGSYGDREGGSFKAVL